jgi:HAD superfamily hydrolase (TIGR01509 family)
VIKQPIELVLFDLGGTLSYEKGSTEALYPRADMALWKVLHEAGVTAGPDQLYNGARTLLELYYTVHRTDADLNEPTILAVLDGLLQQKGFRLEKQALRAALRSMFSITQTNWAPEADSVPTLRLLKSRGYRIGVVSNVSDEENMNVLIDTGGLRPYLEHVVSSAAFGKRKPDSGIFRAALSLFGTGPRRAVMVGDNYEADILGAHGAGMQAIWITRRSPRPLPATAQRAPEAVVEALSEIPPLLAIG